MAKLIEILSGMAFDDTKVVELGDKRFKITKRWGNFQDVSAAEAVGIYGPLDYKGVERAAVVFVTSDEESSFFGDVDAVANELGPDYVKEDVQHLVCPLFAMIAPFGVSALPPEILPFPAALFVLREQRDRIASLFPAASVVAYYGTLFQRWSGAEGFYYAYEVDGRTYKTRDYLIGHEESVCRTVLTPAFKQIVNAEV